jgi:hypothetical protein
MRFVLDIHTFRCRNNVFGEKILLSGRLLFDTSFLDVDKKPFVLNRVARWYIFIYQNPNFGYILEDLGVEIFGINFVLWVYFVVIWYILPRLECCTKKY